MTTFARGATPPPRTSECRRSWRRSPTRSTSPRGSPKVTRCAPVSSACASPRAGAAAGRTRAAVLRAPAQGPGLLQQRRATLRLFGADDRGSSATSADRLVGPAPEPGVRAAPRGTGGVTAGARAARRQARRDSAGRRARDDQTRCDRGAEIARTARLHAGDPGRDPRARRALGRPRASPRSPGEEIPLLGRIVGLAQTVEVFASDLRRRRGPMASRSNDAGAGSTRCWSTYCGRSGEDRTFWLALRRRTAGRRLGARA